MIRYLTKKKWQLSLENLYNDVWNKLCAFIDEKYDMDCLWGKGGKEWEYKYRPGGKTLCAWYAKENCVGFMIILGKDERLKFETDRENYREEVQEIYNKAQTYHDGKWSCLSQWILLCLMTSLNCWEWKENQTESIVTIESDNWEFGGIICG